MLQFAYESLTTLGAPLIAGLLRLRLRRGREDAVRFPERQGVASQARPAGKVLWCHAASVGEAMSLLALIHRLRDTHPAWSILVTTGTVTSARLIAPRLPVGVLHQFIPVDRIPYVRRFLDHWQPDRVLWVESELWPTMIAALRQRRIPAMLINGRMSEQSFRAWHRVRGWSRRLLGAFDHCLAQTEADRARLQALGATAVECVGNLKYAADPLPYNEALLEPLRTQIGARPLWVMASTHEGEEAIAGEAHKRLKAQFPDLLTVIVPRHARRGAAIMTQLQAHQGLKIVRRSQGQAINSATDIYLADTMGELGLFYRLCRVVAIGGSFVPVGGHNPVEAAQLGAAIIMGSHTHNFAAMTADFVAHQAAVIVDCGDPDTVPQALADTLAPLLADPEQANRLARAAQNFAREQRQVLDLVMQRLNPWFETGKKDA